MAVPAVVDASIAGLNLVDILHSESYAPDPASGILRTIYYELFTTNNLLRSESCAADPTTYFINIFGK